jgi:hypothetical protein
MSLFLLVFDRHNREVDVRQLDDRDPANAMAVLFEAEQRILEHPELEIVLLTAADEDDLRRTHARYFESFDDLLEMA